MKKRSKRVIIDTNLWIRFLISRDYSVIDKLLFQERIQLIFSSELVGEFVEVAQRPKFRRFFPLEELSELVEMIEEVADFVEVTTDDIISCRDEKDNFLLCLARDASADYLITEVIERFRKKNEANAPSLEEITKEVEKVRAK